MNNYDLVSLDLRTKTESFNYRVPMKFGGRIVEQATLFNLYCRATNNFGQQATGFGSMTMGVAWAWPSQTLSSAQTLQIVVELAEQFAAEVQKLLPGLPGHPMEICAASHHLLDTVAERVQRCAGIAEPIPALARLLAASPLQAALFDAYGKAAGKSSFAMLGPEFLDGDLSRFLGSDFHGVTLDSFVSAEPAESLPLYHLVGALDPLDNEDVQTAVNDGLPETLWQWILRDQLTHLKIKLEGSDADWDRQRIVAVDRIANECGERNSTDWRYSLDFNERCENETYVLRLLDALEQSNPSLMTRISYIEQPTHRDLRSHPENTMFRVAARLPVVIDESLTDFESLLLARDQGYSGVAIKACKGHGDALLMAAAARHYGMFLCVQDLTCVGASFLHSASLTAHLPGAAAIEGNGRQYCPAANVGFEERFPGMFDVRGGQLPTRQLNGPGLGY